MTGSLTLPRLTGCPCGCATRDECITRTPLPITDRHPCTGVCHSWELVELKRIAAAFGTCPACIERNPE